MQQGGSEERSGGAIHWIPDLLSLLPCPLSLPTGYMVGQDVVDLCGEEDESPMVAAPSSPPRSNVGLCESCICRPGTSHVTTIHNRNRGGDNRSDGRGIMAGGLLALSCMQLIRKRPEDDEGSGGGGGGNDDDDDEVVVLTAEEIARLNPKRRAVEVPTSSSFGNGGGDSGVAAGGGDDDEEVVAVAESSNVVHLPHSRAHCSLFPMPALDSQGNPVSVAGALKYCDKCYCYVCDVTAGECTEWDAHCLATDRGARSQHWANERRLTRRRKLFAARAAQEQQSNPSSSSSSSSSNAPPPAGAGLGPTTLFHFFRRAPPGTQVPELPAPRPPPASTRLPLAPRVDSRQVPRTTSTTSTTNKNRSQRSWSPSSTSSTSSTSSSTSSSSSSSASSVARDICKPELDSLSDTTNTTGTTAGTAAGDGGSNTTTAAAAEEVQVDGWVQCDRTGCQKWRKGPVSVVDKIKGRWVCTMNTWDKLRARCSAPEEAWEE